MKPLIRLWRSLEAIPGLSAIPAYWEAYCGAELDLIRPHLRVTDMQGSLYPCPGKIPGYCPRRIVDYGNGEYAALCRDPFQECGTIALAQKDVLLQRLDIGSFSRMLAGLLGIRWQAPVQRGDGTWGIGLSERRDTKVRPVFLSILPDTDRFEAAMYRLAAQVPGSLVLVAPTARHRTIEVQGLLQQKGATFIALEEHLLLNSDGQLVGTEPAGAGEEIRGTPIEDRRRAVKEFLARSRCRVKDIQEAAGVDEADYYKWLRGKTPDHYSTCQAIERVLRAGLPAGHSHETRTPNR